MQIAFRRLISTSFASRSLASGCAASAISSIMLTLAHSVWGNGFWALVALTPLLIASDRALRTGHVVLFGLLASVGTSKLMFESIIHSHPAGTALAFLSQAPQFIVPLCVWHFFRRRNLGNAGILAFTITWVVFEQLRMHPLVSGTFSSFYSLSLSQVETGLLFPQTLGGTISTSTLILLTNALVASHTLRGTLLGLLPLGVLYVAAAAPGIQYAPTKIHSGVGIQAVQPAWTPSEQNHFVHDLGEYRHIHQLGYWSQRSQETNRYALFPETTLTGQSSVSILQRILSAAIQGVIVGAATLDDAEPANTAFFIDSDDVIRLFDKWQLVPMYETGLFQPGSYVTTFDLDNELTIGILICMDGTNDWLIGQTINSGADVLVVISSSDYGRGFSTPELHLQVIRAQAQLFQTPVLFIASNGPTAYVTPNGFVQSRIDEGIQGVLNVELTRWEPQNPQPSNQYILFIRVMPLALTGLALYVKRGRIDLITLQ